jgi:hypothetical protein
MLSSPSADVAIKAMFKRQIQLPRALPQPHSRQRMPCKCKMQQSPISNQNAPNAQPTNSHQWLNAEGEEEEFARNIQMMYKLLHSPS